MIRKIYSGAKRNNKLNQTGQAIPEIAMDKSNDLVKDAKITPSSTCKIAELPFNGPWLSLKMPTAQMLPMEINSYHNFTPDTVLKQINLRVEEGEQWIDEDFKIKMPETNNLKLYFDHPSKDVPAAVFEICCFN